MAGRGKVKDIKADPTNMRTTGTVVDTETKKEYPFVQPYGEQLGLAKDIIVQFETVESAGVTYGSSLNPVEKGTISTINYELGTGVLKDRIGNSIEFEQAFGKEMGMLEGSVVRYSMVIVDGKPKATCLKIAGN